MTETELKPCPICGREWLKTGGKIMTHYVHPGTDDCPLSGCYWEITDKNIAIWNRRSAEAENVIKLKRRSPEDREVRYITLIAKYTFLRSGVEKVRDEMRESSKAFVRYPSIFDTAEFIKEADAALTRLLTETEPMKAKDVEP